MTIRHNMDLGHDRELNPELGFKIFVRQKLYNINFGIYHYFDLIISCKQVKT